jgi:multiple sugar transport system permease protein
MSMRTESLDGVRARTTGRTAGRRGARPAPGRPGRRLTHDTRSAMGFLSFNATGFTLFTLVPVVYSVYISFFDWPLEGGQTKFIGLGNYRDVLSSYGFWRIVLNVLYFVGAYVSLNLIVSLTLAALLGPRVRAVKGKPLLRVLYFLPVVTPVVASSLVWTLMYGQTGIFNTALGWFGIGAVPWLSSTAWAMPSIIIMSVWLGFGYNMILFIAGMTNIPDSLYDAAAIDGAGPFRQFFKVTLPLLSPLVFFGTLLTLITSFQVFTQAYILTNGGPGDASTTLVLQLYDEAFKYFRLGYGSAIAVLLALLILVVTGLMFTLQRRLVHYEH